MDHEAIWAPLTVLAFLAARFFPFELLNLGPCPWRMMTGVPCPTCGGTRAMMALARMEIPAALALNPLVAAAGIAAAVYVVHALGVWLLGWRRWRPSVSSPGVLMTLRVGAISVLLLNWAYLVLTGR